MERTLVNPSQPSETPLESPQLVSDFREQQQLLLACAEPQSPRNGAFPGSMFNIATTSYTSVTNGLPPDSDLDGYIDNTRLLGDFGTYLESTGTSLSDPDVRSTMQSNLIGDISRAVLAEDINLDNLLKPDSPLTFREFIVTLDEFLQTKPDFNNSIIFLDGENNVYVGTIDQSGNIDISAQAIEENGTVHLINQGDEGYTVPVSGYRGGCAIQVTS